jgi:lipopolysaccharide/colanic/teichoic acid biosynthesis glycosyltransferase
VDILASMIGLLIVAVPMLMIAVVVRLSSPGPIFFRQTRVGQNLKTFDILKFRTMVVDAEKLGLQITAGKDPRVTTIGRILRKTKLDELPQLLNVLKGDMSLVGPRPEVPKYVEMFKEQFERILVIRPGITDLASIKYRDESAILAEADDPEAAYIEQVLPDKLRLAEEYVGRSSLRLDLWVIGKTLLRLLG